MNIVKEYLGYISNAKKRHGIHSPFVYDFTDKCLSRNVDENTLKSFKTYKKALKNDPTIINVKDLGAGSKKLSNKRKVKSIYAVSSSGDKYGKLLYKIAAHYQPKNMLELGTSLGVGSLMLASGNPKGQLHTVEACPETLKVATKNLENHQISNITFYNAAFKDYIEQNTTIFDLVFIDGDHKSDRLLELLALLDSYIHDETLIIIDDIRWNIDMFEGWKKIINDNRYNLTIDLFRMGIIAKRKHQQREHFVIRY